MRMSKEHFAEFMKGKRELQKQYGEAKEYSGYLGEKYLDVGTNKIRIFKDGKWFTAKHDRSQGRYYVDGTEL